MTLVMKSISLLCNRDSLEPHRTGQDSQDTVPLHHGCCLLLSFPPLSLSNPAESPAGTSKR